MTGNRSDAAAAGGTLGPPVDRRRVLTAAAGALAAGLAGCTETTSREFAATPVGLPEAVREELGLAEVVRDSRTTTHRRTVGGGSVEAAITTQFAGYGRPRAYPGSAWSAPRPTLVERFVGSGREATPGSGAAINAVATDLGIEEANPEFVEGDTPVPGDRITLVVPERARHDGEVRLGEVMALHHAEALGVGALTGRGGNNYLVDARQVLPDREFHPAGSSDWRPDERWVAGHEGHWLPDDPSRLRCLVCLGERSPADVFGVEEMPGRRLDEGETVGTEDTLLLSPAPKENPVPDWGSGEPREIFDAGYPTPVGGPTYVLGVVATPNAEVGGTSVNPLARTSGAELLTSDLARSLLADAGLTDADEVEWLVGPTTLEASGTDDGANSPVEWLAGLTTLGASGTEGGANGPLEELPGPASKQVVWSPADTVTVLGEEAGLEVHGGVVVGREGPWAVAVHLAKATPDDVVVPVATHRRPVGTPDGRPLFDGSGFVDQRWTVRATEFTGQVVASLEAASGEV